MIGQDSLAHPPKNKNAKIPDGGGPGFESSLQQQQELDSVHRIGTATAAECSLASLARLACMRNAEFYSENNR
jgi:hypothetical protein